MTLESPTANLWLSRFGYYRLSGYWYPFRLRRADGSVEDNFRAGTNLARVVDMCIFDRKLRLLFSDAIECIEVALRVRIAILLGARSPTAHLDPLNFDRHFTSRATGQSAHDIWLDKFRLSLSRSKDEFVRHFNSKYYPPMPIWMAIELWDFGQMSWLLSGLKYDDRIAISNTFNTPRDNLLPSWIRTLNLVRNICAHHGRLWNRSLADIPRMPSIGDVPSLNHTRNCPQSRIYVTAAIVAHLLQTFGLATQWKLDFKRLIAGFPTGTHLSIGDMGFPVNWEQEAIWN